MPKAMMLGDGGSKGTGCGCNAPAPGTGRLGKHRKALRSGSYRGAIGTVIEGRPRMSGLGGLGRGSHCARIHGEVQCFRTRKAMNAARRRAKR
jgi:hypothetical protein